MMPCHINPTKSERTATAPYNFVPLPKRFYSVVDGIDVNGEKLFPWKMQDRFVPGTMSGWIDLSIKTKTPLFIRGPVLKKNETWDTRDSRLRPEPCTTHDGRPLIPGSSLRGMIRTLVEILSFSKISPITNEKPFFRTVAPDRIGRAYRDRIIQNNQKPRGGYVRRSGNKWIIVPAKDVLRVHQNKLVKLNLKFSDSRKSNYLPDWKGQHQPCWFKRDGKRNWLVSEISLDQTGGWEKGILVLTGSAPRKKYDFVFTGEEINESMEIPERILRRFHDEDQLTQWQEKAFPKDKPTKSCRIDNGYLRNDEPVFFLTDDSAKGQDNLAELIFFGRAQMFRLPYDLSPKDLVSDKIKNAGLDMAEAIFGIIGKVNNEKDNAIKGRVFFEDAVAIAGGPEWYEEVIVPRILSSPKVTCFQHYLTQDGTKDKKDLTTYLYGDKTSIRGHKLYWHRWDDTQRLAAVKESQNHDKMRSDLLSADPEDTQHTIIRPVKSGCTFSSRIRFENLTDMELGALLSALRLPEGCAHKLGMGKPLGLGTIKIDSKLHIVDRTVRYNCWDNSGIAENDGDIYIKTFEMEMIEHARNTGETMEGNLSGLKKISRLNALFHLLQWTEKPLYSKTEYMELKNFKERPVLPTPHNVIGQPEPAWHVDPPRPADHETDSTNYVLRKRITDKEQTKPINHITKPIEKGQIRKGKLKHSSDHWIALFEGDSREAYIINQDKIPSEMKEGSTAEFFITEQSKKGGIKARFEKLV
ncbi:MAG: TIGR03986 family CRISPR-associated RAMP protein [Candidatus Omnitrophica bacterium]|nr:TIGR03986 family CRISPR-associated RAMP protein [Candidatus Omnitrophota bacterium]